MATGAHRRRAASERAAQLTHQMLAYSGKGRFIVEPADISKLIRETLPLIQSSIPRTVQLRLDIDRAAPVAEIDVAQVQQLIMNKWKDPSEGNIVKA